MLNGESLSGRLILPQLRELHGLQGPAPQTVDAVLSFRPAGQHIGCAVGRLRDVPDTGEPPGPCLLRPLQISASGG